MDVRIADEEVTDDDRRPDHLREGLWRVGKVEQGKELVALDQGEDLQRERQVELERSERLVTQVQQGVIGRGGVHVAGQDEIVCARPELLWRVDARDARSWRVVAE